MTMPSKIWAWEIDNDDLPPNGYYSVASIDDSVSYIRADIAEELAQALEVWRDEGGQSAYDDMWQALSRFRA